MAARRQLRFDSLDAAVREAEHLLAVGYDRAGRWDLAQVCGHLSEWLRYQMDGYPKAPFVMRAAFWLMRNTIGPAMGRKAFAAGEMRDGVPTLPQSVPPAGGDDAAAVATLRHMIARWQAHPGPLAPSPMFGTMSKDEWVTGHRIHAAHHLSFLVPKS